MIANIARRVHQFTNWTVAHIGIHSPHQATAPRLHSPPSAPMGFTAQHPALLIQRLVTACLTYDKISNFIKFAPCAKRKPKDLRTWLTTQRLKQRDCWWYLRVSNMFGFLRVCFLCEQQPALRVGKTMGIACDWLVWPVYNSECQTQHQILSMESRYLTKWIQMGDSGILGGYWWWYLNPCDSNLLSSCLLQVAQTQQKWPLAMATAARPTCHRISWGRDTGHVWVRGFATFVVSWQMRSKCQGTARCSPVCHSATFVGPLKSESSLCRSLRGQGQIGKSWISDMRGTFQGRGWTWNCLP